MCLCTSVCLFELILLFGFLLEIFFFFFHFLPKNIFIVATGDVQTMNQSSYYSIESSVCFAISSLNTFFEWVINIECFKIDWILSFFIFFLVFNSAKLIFKCIALSSFYHFTIETNYIKYDWTFLIFQLTSSKRWNNVESFQVKSSWVNPYRMFIHDIQPKVEFPIDNIRIIA